MEQRNHRLEELKKISDRITVMRDGRTVDTVKTEEVTIDRVISMMVGRTIYESSPEVSEEKNPDVVLEVRNLSRGKEIKNVNFSLHRGEILGFAGLLGAGRTAIGVSDTGNQKVSTVARHRSGIKILPTFHLGVRRVKAAPYNRIAVNDDRVDPEPHRIRTIQLQPNRKGGD